MRGPLREVVANHFRLDFRVSEYRVIEGDTLDVLPTLPAAAARCCVTSPPYFGLRDYGHDGQIGLEPTPQEYVAKLVEVFREIRRVLADDGTLWLNLGDSFNAYNGGAGPGSTLSKTQTEQRPQLGTGYGLQVKSLKPKDLIGIPWRVAFALQEDGWYLRSDIIWAKPNPMPESISDRPTKAHEYLFLFAKSQRYYYDAEAIREPFADERMGNPGAYDRTTQASKGANNDRADTGFLNNGNGWNVDGEATGRNKRSVWNVSVQPFSGAHFATFPPKLIEPCILAGSEPGDTILDPFSGAGTTGVVALRNDRDYLGVEINPDYAQMSRNRIYDDGPLLNVEAA